MIVPVLRFKKSDGQPFPEWDELILRKLAKHISLKNRNNKISRVLTNSAVDGVVDQRDFFEKDIANKNNLEGYYIVELGDYVYNPRISTYAPVGPISKNKVGIGVMSPLYTVFRFFNDQTDFYEQYFNTFHWHKYIRLISNSGARHDRMSITNSEFMNMPLPYPHPEEQQKIATFLSTIDDLIIAQSKKIQALQSYKKGLMQQLFPAEGEAVPRVRFGEFLEAGEWKMEKLGEKTLKVGSGTTPKGGDKTYLKDGRPFVRSQNIGWGYLIYDNIAFIDEKTHQTHLSTQIKEGDILLNITGASIGRSAIADRKVNGGNVNQHVCIIRTKEELSPLFANQYLLSQNGQKQIDSFQAGGNRQGLNFEQIRSFAIPLPPTIEEQQKIAKCLITFDDVILAENRKLDALNMQKKGLMQQIFPNPNEIEA